MAIYHLSVRTGSKEKGQSAKAKSDYISREGKYKKEHDEVLKSLSGNMPSWAKQEPGKYWEAADTYERKNGSLFREVEFALPVELSRQNKIALAESFAKKLSKGELPYSMAVHRGKESNPHCHLVLSERVNDGILRPAASWFKRAANKGKAPETGGARKSTIGKNAASRKAWLESTRAMWAERANQALEQAGQTARIDHRTLEAQGIERIPGIHLSLSVMEMEDRGIQTEKAEIAAQIIEANAQIKEFENVRNSYGKDYPSQREPERGAFRRTDGTFGPGYGKADRGQSGGNNGFRIIPERSGNGDTKSIRRSLADQGRPGGGQPATMERNHSDGDLGGVRGVDTHVGRISDVSMTDKYQNLRAKNWYRQYTALGASKYRITLTDATGKAKPWNVGKGKGQDGSEKMYPAILVNGKLAMLANKNSQGRNIYITPIDDRYHFMVLDDTTDVQLDELKQAGFKPALVQESSPGNLQAIFKVPKKPGENEQKAANSVVQRINKKFGDPRFTGVIHPFRLAGFTNRKEKYRDANGNYPFTRIHDDQGGICERMGAVLNDARAELSLSSRPRFVPKSAKTPKVKPPRENKITSVDLEFSRHRDRWIGFARSKGWTLDDSALDYRTCKDLLEFYCQEEVKAVLVNSAGVAVRHYDVQEYAHRTVDKAAQDRTVDLERIGIRQDQGRGR